MDLGVLEGQTRGKYFLDSSFDPSVNQCIEQATQIYSDSMYWVSVDSSPLEVCSTLTLPCSIKPAADSKFPGETPIHSKVSSEDFLF